MQTLPFAKPDAVGFKQLLLVAPTRVYEQAIMGGKASVAATAYMARLAKIDEKTKELIEIGNALVSLLEAKAKQPTRFTFFL